MSSSQGDVGDGDVESQGGDDAAAGGEGGKIAVPAPDGIGWGSIAAVYITQISFAGALYWLADAAIRELCRGDGG